MSVLIKGFEMPKDGCKDCAMVQRRKVFDTCPFLKQEVNGNVERGDKPNGCPLIEVPDTNVGDTICRQAAIQALEEPCKVSDTWTDEYAIGERAQFEKDVKILNSLQPAQPEIVQCKDCKHRDAEDGLCKGRGWPMQLVPDDGFCDKGKRR